MARENSLPAMRAAADNLAMGKPFEFSMRTMLLAVAMMSVAVMFFAMAARDAYNFNPLLWGLNFIAGGAGIGTFAGRPIYGAVCGLLVGDRGRRVFPSHLGRMTTESNVAPSNQNNHG